MKSNMRIPTTGSGMLGFFAITLFMLDGSLTWIYGPEMSPLQFLHALGVSYPVREDYRTAQVNGYNFISCFMENNVNFS